MLSEYRIEDCRNRKNKSLICNYLLSGCKESFRLGLELEHFIIDKKTGNSVDYYGEYGIEKILELIKSEFDESVVSNGHLIGLSNSDYFISLEPSAQLEISIREQSDLKEIERIYADFIRVIKPVIDPMGYEIINMGYHPASKIDELSLLPKDRYQYMYQHFEKTGCCGKNMMKGTAATQVSIDYHDEADFVKKYKAALLLGPILAFITDNAPVFEGTIYSQNMLRQYIWRNVDRARTDIKPDFKQFGFSEYADFVYHAPQIIYKNGNEIRYTDEPACVIYQNKQIDNEDIELILSMVFPDVRVKRYIEIRVADSMPFNYVLAYVAFIKGLFWDTAELEGLTDKLQYSNADDVNEAKAVLSKQGYHAMVYGRDVNEIIKDMMCIAKSHLENKEIKYLELLLKLIENKTTLAQIYKEGNNTNES